MCEWKDFLGDIIPSVSSPDKEFKRPPDKTILHFLRRSAEDLACNSHLFKDTIELPLQCGVDEYPLLGCPEVDRIECIWIRFDECAEYQELVGGYSYDDDCLTLSCAPSCDVPKGLKIEFSYTPDFKSCDMPSLLCSPKYREALVSGTLYYLYGQSKMDWADGSLMLFYKQERAYHTAKLRKRARGRSPDRPSLLDKGGESFWGGRNFRYRT